jgi:hypothetical protein
MSDFINNPASSINLDLLILFSMVIVKLLYEEKLGGQATDEQC